MLNIFIFIFLLQMLTKIKMEIIVDPFYNNVLLFKSSFKINIWQFITT